MNMKAIVTLVLCFSMVLPMAAQQNWQQRNQQQGQRQFSPEAYNKRQEEFVKNEAGLTQQEAQNFFPMMHEMLNKQREVQGKIHHTIMQGMNAKTEADYEQHIKLITDLGIENSKIEQTYYKKFHSVLSWQKIYKVRVALQQFNMEVLKMFTPQVPQQNWQRNQQGRPQMPGQGFGFGQGQGQGPRQHWQGQQRPDQNK